MAQRANVSATWYTWLEQGRGGAPSADVLDRIARALMLTDVEREHLFLLALGRPPEVRLPTRPRALRRDCNACSTRWNSAPPIVKTSTWDIVAWNRAAAVVLADYGALATPAAQSPAPRSSAIPAFARRSLIGKRRALRRGGVPGGRRPGRCCGTCRGVGR